MLYRRNEKGRYEGVTDKGQVVQFEDAAEMVAFSELRKELNALVGSSELVRYDDSVKEIFLPKKEQPKESCKEKTVKFHIHKGVYTVSGARLIKKALA